ncbi:MAG: YbaM family protein [Psychromonas sp.]|nr:YbaM family protein [Alteromonadales bacterium]MCP5077416.1 YbaM family protein [Psychromonas sp.]
MSEEQHNLADAPPAVQIAVDLIQLLEENKIDNKTAVEALQIVLNDFQKKANK